MLSWRDVNELPWDVIFLLGGGFALSVGWQSSGLSRTIAVAALGARPDSVEHADDTEVLFLGVLGYAFGAAGIGAAVGFSDAISAFLAGLSLTSLPEFRGHIISKVRSRL